MAINKRYHQAIKQGFHEIFGWDGFKLKIKGSYADGAVDSIQVNVNDSINEHQIRMLTDLCKSIPNSLSIKRSGAGISVMFY